MNKTVENKSFEFGVRIVKLYKYLCESQKEYTLSKQLLRAGTSIGANIAEAEQAQSRADFVSKLSIALKETVETDYWLRLMRETGYLTDSKFLSIHDNCIELKKMLISIIKKTKQ